jgi:hypothetical protein
MKIIKKKLKKIRKNTEVAEYIYYEDNNKKLKKIRKNTMKIIKKKLKKIPENTMKIIKKKLKKKLTEKIKEKITCDCGSIVQKCYLSRHEKTKKHQQWEQKQK